MSLDSLCRWQVQVSVLCLADTCPSEVHPVFNPVAPYGYLLPNMYFLWQISQLQTCLFKVVGPGLVSTSPAFVRSSASHPVGPHGRLVQKMVNRAPLQGAGLFDTFAQQFVTAPPLVGCVVWSQHVTS